MHNDGRAVEERLDRFVRDRIQPAIYCDHVPLTLSVWQAPREPVPFSEARDQNYLPVDLGWRFGRAWSTIWLKVSGRVPDDWNDESDKALAPEVLIDFGYNTSRSGFQAEALAYDLDGKPIKAIAPKNSWLPWTSKEKNVEFFLEVAANPDVAGEYTFEPTSFGDWDSAPETPLYELKTLQLSRRNKEVWELSQDLWTIRGLMASLPEQSTRRHNLIRAVEDMLDSIDPGDITGSAVRARRILANCLASPANASSHKIVATGHAHIDSAWLWPIRETVRKCARTFSNVLSLMDEHEDFVFSASSAQHYKWIKDYYPTIFEGIKKRVKTGQWQPVGGMWVECDGNLPGSEAMVRQFLYGQKFFQENFDMQAREAWLPDSFGYSAALPQIVKNAGIEFFLSQKMSWNQVNKMPHHTFWWEGLDGTQVFTHFPPADTYISEISAQELSHAESNFAEKGRASISLVPFGWGDGGGGPTREMIAAANRTKDLEGSPKVRMGSALDFFKEALAEYPNAPVWRGEMYLELHRGVLTSQHRTKRGNRRTEALLREAELWASYATIKTGAPYPAKELRECWENVLLMQFHDILPGTAIAWVYREVEAKYEELAKVLLGIIEDSLQMLANEPESKAPSIKLEANSRPHEFNGVPSLGISKASREGSPASAQKKGQSIVLSNAQVQVEIDSSGRISSLLNLNDGRDSIPAGLVANEFQIHNDTPTKWDAWDVDVNYRNKKTVLSEIDDITFGVGEQGEAFVDSTRSINSPGRATTTIKQRISLHPGASEVEIDMWIDWHESEKFLKLAFPIEIHCDQVLSETQFGYVSRPTHTNTSWDYARFEVSQHRYLYLSESNWGIAFGNDSTYGFDVERTPAANGGAVTNVRFSLLRAPHFPDPESDQGEHKIHLRVRPACTLLDAINLGYGTNLPTREVIGNREIRPLVASSSPQVIIESVKLAEDDSNDLIVRLYESTGGRATTKVSFAGNAASIQRTNLLESPIEGSTTLGGSEISLELRAFQIVTLRVSGLKL